MLAALRQRNFALIWLGELISSIGGWVLWIALPFYVHAQTGSALATGTTFFVNTLPPLLLGSLAGVCADRWDRKRTMAVANLSRAAVLLLLLAARSPGRLWIIYPAIFAQSAIAQFFGPAKNGLIPRLVGKEHLMAANSLSSLGSNLAGLAGPALGGVLSQPLGLSGAAVTTSVTFLIYGLLILLITTPAGPAGAQDKPAQASSDTARSTAWRDWLAGLLLVKAERPIAATFAAMGVAMLGQGIIHGLWVIFVRETLAGGALEYGWVQVAVAAGGLIGAFVVERVGRRLAPGLLIGPSGLTIGITLLLTFNFPSLPVILILQFLGGIAGPGFFITIQTLLQTHVADRYLGRVFGAYNMTNALLVLSGQGLASALGDHLGIVSMLNVSGVLYLLGGVVALVTLTGPGARRAREG
jgi:MFS family permease